MLLRSNNQGPPKNIWESFNFIIKEYGKRHYEELVMRSFKDIWDISNLLKCNMVKCAIKASACYTIQKWSKTTKKSKLLNHVGKLKW